MFFGKHKMGENIKRINRVQIIIGKVIDIAIHSFKEICKQITYFRQVKLNFGLTLI